LYGLLCEHLMGHMSVWEDGRVPEIHKRGVDRGGATALKTAELMLESARGQYPE